MSGQASLNLGIEPLTDTTVIDVDVHLSYSSLLEIRPTAYEGGVDRGRLNDAPFLEAMPR